MIPALALWAAVVAPPTGSLRVHLCSDANLLCEQAALEEKIQNWVDRTRAFLQRTLPAEEAYFMDCPQRTVSARLDCHLEHLQVIERKLAR